MTQPVDDTPPLLDLVEYRCADGCSLVLHRSSDGDWLGVWRCRHEGARTFRLPDDIHMVIMHDELTKHGFVMIPA